MAKRKSPPTSKARGKPYQEMVTEELREATAEFDREFVAETFGAPSARQRAQLARAKVKRGRPRIGAGSRTICVTVEKDLLAQADRLAEKLHVPRAALVARGLQAVVGEEVAM
jgi:hypothetical protein